MIFWQEVKNIIQKQYLYTNISHLLQNKADVWDSVLGEFSKTFVNDILNIDTCVPSALDYYWGRIFKITRSFTDDEGNPLSLTDDEFRRVLKVRAFGCSYNGGLFSTNEMLNTIFGIGKSFATDNKDMSMNLFLIGEFSEAEKYIYSKEDVLPRPAGVGPIISSIVEFDYFAFGQYNINDPRFGAIGFGTYGGTQEGRFATYGDNI